MIVVWFIKDVYSIRIFKINISIKFHWFETALPLTTLEWNRYYIWLQTDNLLNKANPKLQNNVNRGSLFVKILMHAVMLVNSSFILESFFPFNFSIILFIYLFFLYLIQLWYYYLIQFATNFKKRIWIITDVEVLQITCKLILTKNL